MRLLLGVGLLLHTAFASIGVAQQPTYVPQPAYLPGVSVMPSSMPQPAASPDALMMAPTPIEVCTSPSALNVRVMPYAWVPGMKGSLSLRRVTTHLDVSIGKVVDIMVNEIDFAAIGRVEATYGQFGVLLDGLYFRVSPGTEVRRLNFSSAFSQTILEGAGTYNLEGLTDLLALPTTSRLEVLAGVRYYGLKAGLTITGDGPFGLTASRSGSKEWMDVIVGLRARVPVCENVTAQIRGDIGGFGLPQSSRFAWNAEAVLEYQCSQRSSVFAGWRTLDVNRQRGESTDKFGYKMQLSGPILGMAFQF